MGCIIDNHYYPFGLNHTDPRRNTGGVGVNLYQYNGKELVEDNGLGWNHYGARAYDAAVARWWVVDPQIEKSQRESGFVYAGNSPNVYIDFNGRFKLPAEFIRDYPMFAKYLQENISEILQSEAIMAGLKTHSNGTLTRERVAKEIKFGEGPTIVIRDLNNIRSADGTIQGKAFGHYDGVVNGDPTIALDVTMMKKFEGFMKRSDVSDAVKEALLLGIVSTLLHEYVHVGTGGKDFENGEHGANFEEAVYGRNIMPDDGTSTLGARTLKKYGEWYNEQSKKGSKDEDSEKQKDPSVLPTLPRN